MLAYARILPELAQWNNGKGIDISSWIYCVGRLDHAIGYSSILWPDFVIHDDFVLFAPASISSFSNWMTHTGGCRKSVEAVMNHRHIIDLFSGESPEVSKEMIICFGRLLREIWQCKLRRDFPNRDISVSFPEDHVDDF
jgi:hypothetical protein